MTVPLLSDTQLWLVRLYLAVVYGLERELHPHEREAVAGLLCRWQPTLTVEAAEAVVDTAHVACRSDPGLDVGALARRIGTVLSPAMRRRVLSDLGRVATADGHVTLSEASAIARVRAVWAGL